MRNPHPTKREHSVIQCLIDGMRNKEIAYRLNLSENTIKIYINRLHGKLQTGGDRFELAKWGRAYAESQRIISERYRELYPDAPEQKPAFEGLEIAKYDVLKSLAQSEGFTQEQVAEVAGILLTGRAKRRAA